MKKSRFSAAILAFFLGGIGINNFYTGHVALGILDILFCWTMIPTLLNLIRACKYLWCSDDIEFITKYVE